MPGSGKMAGFGCLQSLGEGPAQLFLLSLAYSLQGHQLWSVSLYCES